MSPQTLFSIFTIIIICMTVIAIHCALIIGYKKEQISVRKTISFSIITCLIGYIVIFILMLIINYLFEKLM
ncbi:hypothetical protein [Niallia sp. 01092]|uniref:hypothetical protein n=1 Tax=unclassified Niallia TaxID=2837522 RepID=UPI003FD46194